jgi:hypothetical protein
MGRECEKNENEWSELTQKDFVNVILFGKNNNDEKIKMIFSAQWKNQSEITGSFSSKNGQGSGQGSWTLWGTFCSLISKYFFKYVPTKLAKWSVQGPWALQWPFQSVNQKCLSSRPTKIAKLKRYCLCRLGPSFWPNYGNKMSLQWELFWPQKSLKWPGPFTTYFWHFCWKLFETNFYKLDQKTWS